MADIVTPAVRSRMMSGIRSKNTRNEIEIRKALHAAGFRYRLHRRNLPGTPDITLPRYRAVIFIHGCFWHGHNCHLFKWPSTRPEFWTAKIGRNRERDQETRGALLEAGWRWLVVWECAIRGKHKLEFDRLIGNMTAWLKDGLPNCEIRGDSDDAVRYSC